MKDSTRVRLHELLERTSRTFALAIPCLPEETEWAITVAYLVFRISDTLEDAPYLSREEKLDALRSFAEMVAGAGQSGPICCDLRLPRAPSSETHYLELLSEVDEVIASLQRMPKNLRDPITRAAHASNQGMQRFVAKGSPGRSVWIASLSELRSYCYCVAGVVGEMLTEIFVVQAPSLLAVRPELDRRARLFGEGLQLVNILKDSEEDAEAGRIFVAEPLSPDSLMELARSDLDEAEEYVSLLRHQPGVPRGFISFTELPLRLAWRTLDCIEKNGPGSKISRDEVMRILGETLERNHGPVQEATDMTSH